MRKVLIIEGQEALKRELLCFFQRSGFGVLSTDSLKEAGLIVDSSRLLINVVVVDVGNEDEQAGIEVIKKYRSRFPASRIIAISGSFGKELCSGAIKAGADRFLLTSGIFWKVLQREFK